MWLNTRAADGAAGLAGGEVHLWLVHLDRIVRDDAWAAALPAARLRAAADVRDATARRRYLTAHAALQVLLAAYAGVPAGELALATGCFGKPRLAAPRRARTLSFSLSHAGDVCLIGLTRAGALGVDIERLDRRGDSDALAQAILSAREHARWRALAAPARRAALLQTWTCKEAILKALGVGLALNPRLCEIEWSGTGARIAALDGPVDGRWSVAPLPAIDARVAAWAAPAGMHPALHAVLDRLS